MAGRNLRLTPDELRAIRAEAHELCSRLSVRDAAQVLSYRHGWTPTVGRSTVSRWAAEHRADTSGHPDVTHPGPLPEPAPNTSFGDTVEDILVNVEGALQLCQDMVRSGEGRPDVRDAVGRIRAELKALDAAGRPPRNVPSVPTRRTSKPPTDGTDGTVPLWVREQGSTGKWHLWGSGRKTACGRRLHVPEQLAANDPTGGRCGRCTRKEPS